MGFQLGSREIKLRKLFKLFEIKTLKTNSYTNKNVKRIPFNIIIIYL